MKPFEVRELDKELVVRFSDKTVVLPEEIQEKIDTYWEGLLASGKNYRRGEVFTVTHVDESADRIDVLVEKSDYAHYLYCQNVDTLGECGVRIIHTACLVITSDNKAVLGEMGPQTARAGMYQLCGGGIELKNLRGDVFDFDENIIEELQEELGIDVEDSTRVKSFGQKYLKSGGPTGKMTAIYKLVLRESETEFLERYNFFEKELVEKAENPEFERIVTLDLNKKDEVKYFLMENKDKCDEYIEPLFERVLEPTS